MAFTLFQGTVVEHGALCALHSLVHGALLTDLRTGDRLHALMRAMAETPPPARGRQWFRARHDDILGEAFPGAPYYYISLNPGGYRATPPTEPDAVITDLAVDLSAGTLRDELRGLVADVRRHERPQRATAYWCASADRLIDGRAEEGFAASRARFRQAAAGTVTGDAAQYQAAVTALYQDVFHGLLLPNADFTAAMLLLQLQGVKNRWIEGCTFERAHQTLADFVAHVKAQGQRITDAETVRFARWHFDSGRTAVEAALQSGSLMDFQAKLYRANHHFLSAFLLALMADGPMPYSVLVAEEGYACSRAGLLYGFTFYNKKPFALAEEFSRRIGPDIEASETELQLEYSSAQHPDLPRFLFELYFALALVRKDGRHREAGVARFAECQQTPRPPPSLGHDFSGYWFDTTGLKIAKATGDEEAAHRFAARLVGRLMVGGLVGE
jgi:hypothetical protein